MKIKTVIYPIDEKNIFDRIINTRLQNGWKLNKRDVITANGEPNEVGSSSFALFLYAELEKEI